MSEERPEVNRTNVRIMVVLAVLLAIGIATRWSYIREEVSAVIENLFSVPDRHEKSLPPR